MQAIPGQIKALVISNEMPDENTDENTTQPPYRLSTCFIFFFFFFWFMDVEKKEAKKPKSTPKGPHREYALPPKTAKSRGILIL